MMVGTSLLAGGAFYIGYKTYTFVKEEQPLSWWQALVTRLEKLHTKVLGRAKPLVAAAQPRPLSPVDWLIAKTPPLETLAFDIAHLSAPTAQFRLVTAATALTAATVGTLYYAPLRLVCVPALLYLGVSPIPSAYTTWQEDRRVAPAVAESAAVVFCLIQGYFLVGSFGFFLYYLGQVVATERDKPQQSQCTWQPPSWAWRQSPEGEVITPVSNLQVGELIVVHAGEMVPLTGVVTNGVAWARLPGAAAAEDWEHLNGVKICVGQMVDAATIVLVGSIGVVVTAA